MVYFTFFFYPMTGSLFRVHMAETKSISNLGQVWIADLYRHSLLGRVMSETIFPLQTQQSDLNILNLAHESDFFQMRFNTF